MKTKDDLLSLSNEEIEEIMTITLSPEHMEIVDFQTEIHQGISRKDFAIELFMSGYNVGFEEAKNAFDNENK